MAKFLGSFEYLSRYILTTGGLVFIFMAQNAQLHCTANMCREITVKLQSKKCNSEKLQFFTVGHSSLYFLQVKNCNFSIIFL